MRKQSYRIKGTGIQKQDAPSGRQGTMDMRDAEDGVDTMVTEAVEVEVEDSATDVDLVGLRNTAGGRVVMKVM